jgi:hypothetical protein
MPQRRIRDLVPAPPLAVARAFPGLEHAFYHIPHVV